MNETKTRIFVNLEKNQVGHYCPKLGRNELVTVLKDECDLNSCPVWRKCTFWRKYAWFSRREEEGQK